MTQASFLIFPVHCSRQIVTKASVQQTSTVGREPGKKNKSLFLAHFLYLILLISLKEKVLGWTGGKQSKLITQINRQHTFSGRRRK